MCTTFQMPLVLLVLTVRKIVVLQEHLLFVDNIYTIKYLNFSLNVPSRENFYLTRADFTF